MISRKIDLYNKSRRALILILVGALLLSLLLAGGCAKKDDNQSDLDNHSSVTNEQQTGGSAGEDASDADEEESLAEGDKPQMLPVTDYEFPEESSPSGDMTKFKTLNIMGEPVDQTIFAANKVTLVNFWGTFCTPCLEELPFLAELNKQYKNRGFGVVGVIVDVKNGGSLDVDQVNIAKTAILNTGADYPQLIPSQGLDEGILGLISYIPYTIFVDSKGKQIGEGMVGARSKAEWETEIKKHIQ